MAPKVYRQYTGVLSCVTEQDLGSLAQKRGAKTDSDQLQNVSQGLLPCLDPKWPKMAPSVYHQYSRVSFFVNAKDWGPFWPFWVKWIWDNRMFQSHKWVKMECKYEKLIFSKNSQGNIWRTIFLAYQHIKLFYLTDRPDVTRQFWCKWLRGAVQKEELYCFIKKE